MNHLPWRVVDESHERPGFICLAIREEVSGRLVADLADHPDDIPAFVERTKEEANIIAHSRELLDRLRRMVDAAPEHDDTRFRNTLRDARDLIAKVDGK